MKQLLALLIVLTFCSSTRAQDAGGYQKPPKDILDLVLVEPTPAVALDPGNEWMLLLGRSDYPSIAELAEPELRIAGLRINPANFGPSRSSGATSITIKNIRNGQSFTVEGLPANLQANSITWAPGGKRFAFVQSSDKTRDLYVVDLQNFKASKVNNTPLNTILGGSVAWLDANHLLYKTIVPGKTLDAKQEAPSGPVVQENIGKTAASRTYQDLIRNGYDEALFEFYATSQLVINDLSAEKVVGAPAIYRNFSVSPDRNYVLLQTIKKPFSYLVSAGGFPHLVTVIDRNGTVVRTIADNPSSEGQPIGNDDAVSYPRSFDWRDDEPSTLTYVQAIDGGMGKKKSQFRDALYAITINGNGQPKELFKTTKRFGGITWGNNDIAIVTEQQFATRKMRMSRFNPSTGMLDSLYERSSTDEYSDIGYPMTELNQYGKPVLIVLNGKELLLKSNGASPEGSMPLLQTFDVTNGKKKLVWKSVAPYYETVVAVVDPKAGVFVTSKESTDQAPNYYLVNTKKKIAPIALTSFKNPYAALEGVKRQKITYQRADGITLTGDLYLPKNYDAAKQGPLPVLMWAYPVEYKSAADAAQVRGSKYNFTRVSYGSPIYWVTQGYAVLDNAAMPIVGEGTKEPNDNFIPQLYLNAHAAIQKLASMGVGDSNRVAVGGHSYGAFMTANLLAHTKLFKAGIARSGAYNRTLTPFGFQYEERSYWEAPDVYIKMSPFSYADKIKTPLLLVHGEMDNNPGTFPIQSERLYNAIKGHGGTVRYVVLPYESHGYSAKENILHLLWEQNQWLEKWVKNGGNSTATKDNSSRQF